MYNIYQLQDFARKFLKDTYNLELVVPLKLNGRMKTTCGWFRYKKRSRVPVVVELNKFFVENNESDLVIDVLKHELIHYALFMKGIPCRDGDYEFEKELKRLGVVSQSTINQYNVVSKPRNLHYYRCQESSCNKEYRLKRALRNQGIHHRCNCGGRLIDLGKKVVAS